MRTQAPNKAADKKCPHCTREVGYDVDQCRPSPAGWFCWAQGLIYGEGIPPTPDPISEAEQAVIKRYAPMIDQAQQQVDLALASYTLAQQAHINGLQQAQEIGITGTVASLSWTNPRPRHATDQQKREMTERLTELFKGEEAARGRLARARVRLGDLEQSCDRERRIARQQPALAEYA